MKRTLKMLGALLLLVVLLAVAVSAESTLPASCPQCNKTVEWKGISTVEDKSTIPAGHYYMDYTEEVHTWTDEKSVSGAVCLYMNGKTLTAADRVFTVVSGGTLSICGEGTVKAGNFTVTGTVERYGGVVRISDGGKLVLRDATLTD